MSRAKKIGILLILAVIFALSFESVLATYTSPLSSSCAWTGYKETTANCPSGKIIVGYRTDFGGDYGITPLVNLYCCEFANLNILSSCNNNKWVSGGVSCGSGKVAVGMSWTYIKCCDTDNGVWKNTQGWSDGYGTTDGNNRCDIKEPNRDINIGFNIGNEGKLHLKCTDICVATAEVCDGIDNDCDGSIDEGLTKTTGCSQVGYCAGAHKTCSAGTWSQCSKLPQTEMCDAIDNNCDGQVDEGCSCMTGQTQPVSCGLGICQNTATQTCTAAGRWSGICAPKPEQAEICDGIDNDCDGAIDDGCDSDQDGYIDSNMGCGVATTAITPKCTNDDGTQTRQCLSMFPCDDQNKDCNDDEPSINPFAAEIPSDHIDQDCDGKDECARADKDNDGFPDFDSLCSVYDCVDDPANDPARCPAIADGCDFSTASCAICKHPGAQDICNNGIDEDCDGTDSTDCRFYPHDRIPFTFILSGIDKYDLIAYTWDFGDGNTFGASRFEDANGTIHLYDYAGDYIVTLSIMDKNYGIKRASTSVSIESAQDGHFCLKDDDCKNEYCNPDSRCSTESCSDGWQNQDEADVDCGHNCPDKCKDRKKCLVGSDCQAGLLCDPFIHFCRYPTVADICNNHVIDEEYESDVDCGGSCSANCENGKHCNVNSDCQSNNCVSGTCQAVTTTTTGGGVTTAWANLPAGANSGGYGNCNNFCSSQGNTCKLSGCAAQPVITKQGAFYNQVGSCSGGVYYSKTDGAAVCSNDCQYNLLNIPSSGIQNKMCCCEGTDGGTTSTGGGGSCTDTDGVDVNTKGHTYGTHDDGVPFDYWDYCTNNELTEYWCNLSSYNNVGMSRPTCPNLCSEGRCTSGGTNPPPPATYVDCTAFCSSQGKTCQASGCSSRTVHNSATGNPETCSGGFYRTNQVSCLACGYAWSSLTNQNVNKECCCGTAWTSVS